MKKYIKIAKGAVGVAGITGVGAAVIGKLGGSTTGLDTLSSMMPTAISAEMGGNILGSLKKYGRRSRRRKR